MGYTQPRGQCMLRIKRTRRDANVLHSSSSKVLMCVAVPPLHHMPSYRTQWQWLTQKFFSGGGSTNSVEDRENGDLGVVDPLVRGSGGSCNLVQEISFHIVKFS